MKRTAKSILAALLTLMMLISPLVIVGSAEENAAAATTVVDSFSSIYNIGAGAGTLQDGNDISFGSAAGGINAFPQSTALKSNLNLGGSPRRISLSFTVDTDGTGTLPTIDVRLYPAGNKSGNRSYTLVSLSGSNITVEYEKIISELEHIGNNMNQLAAKAHSLGFIDEPEYRQNANRVWRTVAQLAMQLARGGIKIGGNENMERKKPLKTTD